MGAQRRSQEEVEDEVYVRHVRDSVIYENKPMPRDEFAESFENMICTKAPRNIGRDLMAYLSGIKSLYQHLFMTEFIIIVSVSVGVTLLFCYYLYPGPVSEYHLAARLRFNIIGTAVLFPSTILVSETITRRNQALQRFAAIKGEMCQILDAFLTWRSPNIEMSAEWEEEAFVTMSHAAILVHSILLQPTIRDRHKYTREGRAFAESVLRRSEELKEKLIKAMFRMHCLVEDLKEAGLSPMESIRLFQYIQVFSTSLDIVCSIKRYRTTRSSRAYSRIVVTVCIMFYGPYYSFVAGAIDNQGGVDVAFACVLGAFSAVILLAIIAQHRAAEDPFVWHTYGNAVDVTYEAKDVLMKMEGVYRICRNNRRTKDRRRSEEASCDEKS